ncbi:serine hydrolase [Carboxylicivirga sp. M1479]|uniref:serine hydrolase domain-containing protein n=1 Tax=Carboxylicivirga sp. M1479 TaxID=2594476 RepID=UPI001178AE88|nr:serine hydrolase [Carboxylicivirga sp. M1479]TRX64307.1 serine hydrolase [Carboxylicivirga sp. M1479]
MKISRFIFVCLCLCLSLHGFAQETTLLSTLDEFTEVQKQFKIHFKQNSLPIKDLEENKIGFLVSGSEDEWSNLIYRYNHVPIYSIGSDHWLKDVTNDSIEHLIVITDSLFAVQSLEKKQALNIISLIVFSEINETEEKALLWAANLLSCSVNNYTSHDLAIQLLFGAISQDDDQSSSHDCFRLRYLPPESIGLNNNQLKESVSHVVEEAITAQAFPGCRILVAVKGTVIFNQCYGYHTYDKRTKVQLHDVYDLASVTKISGPLPLLMKAYDSGLMDLDRPFSQYWNDWRSKLFRRSNKDAMTVRQVLAHQAQLSPYINYYPWLMKGQQYNEKFFSVNASEQYQLKIDEHLYLSTKFKKTVYKAIRKSELLPTAEYKYSGLSFMLYPQLLSDLYQKDYEQLLYDQFYKPLGASSLVYNPIGKIKQSRIVPTENDANFRKKQIKGLVHDEAAAVMGGISGNAGLFGSADDLAKLLQMYLQKGWYNGVRYLTQQTVNEFTKVQFAENDNRRGAGFDKPLFGNDTLSIKESYPAPGVSKESYGHSGYTGTFVWIDPKYEMVFIFLSNRVYPTRDNPLIYRMNVRPRIQQIFYDALNTPIPTNLPVSPD